jgi:hypothetical protein
MLKPKQFPAATASLTVRFPQELLAVARQSAEDNDRSLNAEIVHALRRCMQAYQAEKCLPALAAASD